MVSSPEHTLPGTAAAAAENEPAYAELACFSNYTFLHGASHPEELVERADALGYTALALTDECSVAGVVRAHVACRGRRLRLLIGSRFHLEEGVAIILIARNRAGYGQLCTLISDARLRAPKGSYRIACTHLEHATDQCLALLCGDPEAHPTTLEKTGRWLHRCFPGRAWIGVALLLGAADRQHLHRLQALAQAVDLPLVAIGDVHMHQRERRPLQDTLRAIRLRCPVRSLGLKAMGNGERHLRPRSTLARIYPAALLHETGIVADRCDFSLDELRYEYPGELVPPGQSAAAHLRRLTLEHACQRWPDGIPDAVQQQIEHELALIAELDYAHYFLTVHDLVAWARARGILCQGRGSAANSAVCYALGITAVDPARSQLLFERFISRERNEPPDIDVDFEHERREEVIQYVFNRYGCRRAALTATVVRYRSRSAIRDVGKALDLDPGLIETLAASLHRWDDPDSIRQHILEAGADPGHPEIRLLLRLVRQLIGFPRHFSQHTGGIVISRGPLHALVPIENAAMDNRRIIQWDKDDLDAMGLLKIDILALGMLSAIRRSLDLIRRTSGQVLALTDIPEEDPAVYAMLQRADSVGVFQVESRAQMAMLPRLRPRCYYDLVIQVAIVRPGPIQGDMVHPYLRRRAGLDPVTMPGESVRPVLERTLGIPIFQEQVMRLAQVAAGFTPEEADQLRRGMAAWRHTGNLGPFEDRLRRGMAERGYPEDFARQILRQIRGFGEYGFPESHAASFALLVYVSAWLKCHHPAVFTCALLNSQPMGFHAPAQLLRDAREHGVVIRPVDVCSSEAECTLETGIGHPAAGHPAIRVGLNVVKGLSGDAVSAILDARRRTGRFHDMQHFRSETGIDRKAMSALVRAGALASLAGHRRRALWQALDPTLDLALFRSLPATPAPAGLQRPRVAETVRQDYASLGFSLNGHPVAAMRPWLDRGRYQTAAALQQSAHGTLVRAAGLVINRQRPGSAKGVTFITLEDETGQVNLVVWPAAGEAQRRVLLTSRVLGAIGHWQRQDGVCHLIVGRLTCLDAQLR